MAKLLNITIADLSYEKEPGRSENKGVNHDEQVSDTENKKNIKDDINFDQQIPVVKSFETDEDFINEEKIIGISGLASISSQSNIPNHQESPSYICSVCDVIFSQKKDLKKHMDIHFNEDVFPCDKCGKVFKSMTSLKLHKLSHGNLPLPKVKEIGKITKEVSEIKETGKSETTETPKEFHCPICPRTYTRKATLNQHMNLHTGLKPYKCLTCGKGFRNRIIRNSHAIDCFAVKDVKINGKNDITENEMELGNISIAGNPVVENINIKKEIPEDIDNIDFDNTKEIDENINIKNEIPGDIDNIDFDNTKEIDKKVDQTNFACKVCRKVFSSKNSLDKHTVLNNCEKNYQCPFCPTKFIHKGNIKRHVKIKHPGEDIEASNKVSVNPSENETNESLLIHKCNHCPKAFLKENNLKIHSRKCKKINTNIEDAKQEQYPVKSVEKLGAKTSKPPDFTCDDCGGGFSLQKDLMKHLSLRICFKNQCPSCPKRFKQKEDLDWHIDIDHDLSDVE